jgi:alanine racemase
LNRMGIPYGQAYELIEYIGTLKNLRIIGALSALTEDAVFDREQLQRFLSLQKQCVSNNIIIPNWSIASSEALFLFPESYLGMARIGMAMYGYYPSQEAQQMSKMTLTPAAALKTRVACIKELNKGESVFYRRSFIAKRKTRIAVLLAGYSYGIDTRLVNGGEVLIRGKKFPLVGGISATNSFVDLGQNSDIQTNDEVVFFGKQGNQEIKLEDVCKITNQSEYEFLSRIPERVERIYS